jgi:hypothetical protein
MDCEKFDEAVMDALYGELDELALAAFHRHVDACARCRAVWEGFESTRRAAVLPMEEPPRELSARILEAERRELGRAPWHRKLLRAVAWAGSHAMRPQLAMAALFMLVVGSSLLLLRGRHGDLGVPIEVTERGEPASAAGRVAAPTALAEVESIDGAAKRARSASEPEAQSVEAKGEAAAMGPSPAPPAAAKPRAGGAADEAGGPTTARRQLDVALDVREQRGCAAALDALREVASTFGGTDEAREAARAIARCEAGSTAGAGVGAAASASAAPAAPPQATTTP